MTGRSLAALFGLALLARAVAALVVPSPPYTDPAYYTLVAERLADGHGFTVPALWSFLEVGGTLPADPTLPVASNGHWMPLTSLVAAPFIAALGPFLGDWRAAQLPFVLLSSALVPMTAQIGWEVWKDRTVAYGSAILMLLGGPMLILSPLVANFAVFGVCGALAIWCSLRAVGSHRPGAWIVAAGALAGLGTLARVDGLLLAAAPATAWWLRRSAWSTMGSRLAWGAASALAFLVVVSPWLIRDLATFGSILPSAGGHTLWITSYNEQFSISHDPSIADYLAAGPGVVIGSKLAAWGELVGRVAVLMGGFFILPFAFGLWRERRRPLLSPFLAYFVVMFVVMGLVFTFHAPRGAFYHSALAWLPFAYPLAVANLAPMATAVGRWWPFLRRDRTHRFLLIAGLVAAAVLSLVGSMVFLAQWADARTKLTRADAFLDSAAAPGDRVMAYDPSLVNLATGLETVPPPFDKFDEIGRVVDAYDVRWVVVTLNPGETRDPLGLWDGAAATDSAGAHPDFLPDAPAFEGDGVRVYEVTR